MYCFRIENAQTQSGLIANPTERTMAMTMTMTMAMAMTMAMTMTMTMTMTTRQKIAYSEENKLFLPPTEMFFSAEKTI